MSRVDGLAKVTGAKVYGRDFFPRDLEGWPRDTTYMLLLRAAHADRPYVGIDMQAFPQGLAPLKVVREADLRTRNISSLEQSKQAKFGRYWLVQEGAVPEHVGQPVAVAFFDRPDAVRDLCQWQREGNSVLKYGVRLGSSAEEDVRRLLDPLIATVEREAAGFYGGTHLVREADPQGGEDIFSRVKNGRHDPTSLVERPDMSESELRQIALNRQARQLRDVMEQRIAEQGWELLDRTFSTPIADPMFMEPEAGLAWWDKAVDELLLVLGTQSPAKDLENVRTIFKAADCPWHRTKIRLKACYPGGGFGGRDESSFPLYLSLGAVFAEGPVRLCYDRFEQFLTGIKRHASVVHNRLAYDREGNIRTLLSTCLLDGGGELNLSLAVAGLSALHAAGVYRIPSTALSAVAVRTHGVPAGSMRGFGIPQVVFALESMVDEIAAKRREDPISLRLRHVLHTGDRDVTGMVLEHHLANVELCELAQQHPLWLGREAAKAARSYGGIRYGVGFALCMEAYGTTTDAILTDVGLLPDGQIRVRSSGVDMGQGTATAAAMATAPMLGRPAEVVEMGHSALFNVLRLKVNPTLDPHHPVVDPRETPKLGNAMSASMTAFHHLHAIEEACEVLYDYGILPAAQAIWGESTANVQWEDGCLVAEGKEPLPLTRLVARAYQDGLAVGAMVHTYYQARFATAEFKVQGVQKRRFIDALAILWGQSGDYALLDRQNVVYPQGVSGYQRTLYASVGNLIGVEVHERSGEIRVREAVTFLDAGDPHHYALLAGQVEGGFAMGLGQALYEELPPGSAGVDGLWNLHRYQVCRAHDMPLARFELVLVPLGSASVLSDAGTRPRIRKKGIAEAAMTTVAPAIHNAVAHATGLRINRLPMTPERVLEALTQQ